jgi:hypothetical protein
LSELLFSMYPYRVMSAKLGRNDPCPCGSEKKFKKCCGLDSAPSFRIPESERTGTPFDDYMELMPLLAMYGQKVQQFEEDGQELKKAASDFEKLYHPGEPGGLTDSFFMSWLHFDLRFGPNGQTIVERILADPLTRGLNEPGPTLIRRMGESYMTFYEVVRTEGDTAQLEELGTNRRWTVFHVRELTNTPAIPGEIWYTRLIGPVGDALSYTTPYVFDPESKSQFARAVRRQAEDLAAGPRAADYPRERHFAESQKDAVLFWAEFIQVGLSMDESGPFEIPGFAEADESHGSTRPLLFNTDHEVIMFTTDLFRVIDEPAVRKRLASLKSFDYDDKDDSWTWHKGASRKDPGDLRTIRNKLEGFLGKLIVHQETRWRDQNELPDIPPEERERIGRETEALNALPEVQAALGRHMEHYYFKKWPGQKVPMLGGLTPLEAVKTEAGRRKLEDLFSLYEWHKNRSRAGTPTPDLDRLRSLIGLPPKSV